jgi:RNA polymerase sigma-32 factor
VTNDPADALPARIEPVDFEPVVDSGLVPSDPIARYFAEVSRYPLLTRDEEFELARLVHDEGDSQAGERLVLSNLRLVIKIAMEYRRVWTNLLDLIQEGNVGLLQGVKRFDPHRGVKLSSYVAYWIRAYILKYLIDNIRMVRLGSSRAERKLFFRLNKAKRELARAGFDVGPKLLAEHIGVQESDVVEMEHRLSQGDLSMDAPVRRGESDSSSFGDFVAAEGQAVDEIVSDRDMRETFLEYVERFRVELDERDQQILRERILAEDPKTLQELGNEFGLTRERVRQLESRLVQRLSKYLRENLVDFDYWAPRD